MHPLVREAAQDQQTRNCLTVIYIWCWAPDPCLTPRQTGRLTVGSNITFDFVSDENFEAFFFCCASCYRFAEKHMFINCCAPVFSHRMWTIKWPAPIQSVASPVSSYRASDISAICREAVLLESRWASVAAGSITVSATVRGFTWYDANTAVVVLTQFFCARISSSFLPKLFFGLVFHFWMFRFKLTLRFAWLHTVSCWATETQNTLDFSSLLIAILVKPKDKYDSSYSHEFGFNIQLRLYLL
jgi:hypothetical protein